ncbi:extracellular solute-binding protein [Solihabitans fulvus]|uniref:Extracellular solute-binding protein n=1 Tax=Solihabitans fulvus TaxID=1892852 RepID=A0A5B2XBU9_9PSEU|nr:extracellular solute-binding protein [Solihabitans fulvus]KAA2260676.1 extracellular solute-binding protein [Solihabitans fulvus]
MTISRMTFAVLAAGVVMSLAAACSNSGSGTDASTTGPITLKLWTWTGAPGGEAMKRAIDAYTKDHPNVTITNTEVAAADFKAKVPLALKGGEQIDVLAVQPSLFAEQIKDQLLPVSAWEKDMPSGTMNKFQPLALEQNKKLYSDGQLYSVPFGLSGSAVGFYNAALLKELGVQPPQTFTDMAALAKTLKDKKPGVAVAVMPSGADSWFQDEFALTLAGQNDKDFFNNVRYHNGKWDTPAYEQALTSLRKIYADGGLDKNVIDVDYAGAEEKFATGKAAILFNGTWDSTLLSPDFRKANKIALTSVGAMPVPAVSDPSARSLRSFLDVTMGIPKTAKYSKEAADFIAYVTTGAGADLWSKNLGLFPAVQGWTARTGDPSFADEEAGAKTIQALLTSPHSDRNNMSAFSAEVGKKVLKVIGGSDPATAAKEMQDDLDSGKFN